LCIVRYLVRVRDGNGRELGNASWENMGMGFKFQIGMGMKSMKWEGIGTKNQLPHISSRKSHALSIGTDIGYLELP